MIGRCDNKAFAVVLFEELKKRVQHPANFTHVVPFRAFCAYGVELVEEINPFRLSHRGENKAQFRRGFAHKLGHEPIELDGEQRDMQFASKRRRRHCFARAWGTDQKKLPPRRQAMPAKLVLLPLLPNDPFQALFKASG